MKLISIFALCLLLLTTEQAQAVTLFEDNFDGYTGNTDFRNGITSGSSGWHAGQFQPNLHPTLSNVGVMGAGGLVFGSGNVAWFLEDAGILLNISTVGYNEAFLSFDWRTVGASVGEKFYSGYFTGDLSDEFPANNAAPFFAYHGNSWFNNSWNIISSGTALWGGHSVENYRLPGGIANLWLAFWFDNNYIGGWDCDYAVLDNLSIRANGNGGEPIPEPATVLLLGSGLIGALRFRRGK